MSEPATSPTTSAPTHESGNPYEPPWLLFVGIVLMAVVPAFFYQQSLTDHGIRLEQLEQNAQGWQTKADRLLVLLPRMQYQVANLERRLAEQLEGDDEQAALSDLAGQVKQLADLVDQQIDGGQTEAERVAAVLADQDDLKARVGQLEQTPLVTRDALDSVLKELVRAQKYADEMGEVRTALDALQAGLAKLTRQAKDPDGTGAAAAEQLATLAAKLQQSEARIAAIQRRHSADAKKLKSALETLRQQIAALKTDESQKAPQKAPEKPEKPEKAPKNTPEKSPEKAPDKPSH